MTLLWRKNITALDQWLFSFAFRKEKKEMHRRAAPCALVDTTANSPRSPIARSSRLVTQIQGNQQRTHGRLYAGLKYRHSQFSRTYRVFQVKEDKKKRHISASREAWIIPKIALACPVTANFEYKKFRTLSLKVLGLQSHKSNYTFFW